MPGGRELRRWIGGVGALLISLAVCDQASASVEACYRLAKVVSPSDLKIAYTFATQHGQCLADFSDPAFDAVAAGLTGLMVSGAITPGTCSSLLNNVNSPAVKTLQQTVPDLNIVSEYLNCGCAVASSGIADRIKAIVDDIRSCAASFDPSGAIVSGLDTAGTTLGLPTLWGLSGNAHDPRAGVGNGGAPTTNTICQAGGWYDNAQCYDCTGPNEKYWDANHPGQFWCQPCAKGQALQGGKCAPCQSGGSSSFSDPNPIRTQCVTGGFGSVTNPCKPNQKWNGGGGSQSICCQPWEKIDVGPHDTCIPLCPTGQAWSAGGTCTPCPANTQVGPNGQCAPCPQGSTSKAGSLCAFPFPIPQCGSDQINLPANPYQCQTCPTGTAPNAKRDYCLWQGCQGDTVPNVRRDACIPCQPGFHPDAVHETCKPNPPMSLTPSGPIARPTGTRPRPSALPAVQ